MNSLSMSDLEIENHLKKIAKNGFTIIENVLLDNECKNISDEQIKDLIY